MFVEQVLSLPEINKVSVNVKFKPFGWLVPESQSQSVDDDPQTTLGAIVTWGIWVGLKSVVDKS